MSAAPTPALSVDSLIVGLDEVQQIAVYGNLSYDSRFDVHQPTSYGDASEPEPCRVVFDQRGIFGSGWTQFRAVEYSGESNLAVNQAVAIFPGPQDARAALGRVSASLGQCASLGVQGYDYTVKTVDPSTVAACYADGCRVFFAVRSSVFIHVSVHHLAPNSEKIGTTVVERISDRILAAA